MGYSRLLVALVSVIMTWSFATEKVEANEIGDISSNIFLWSNSDGFKPSENCSVAVDGEHPFGVSKFYSSRGKKQNYEFLRSSRGKKQFNLANFSLLRIKSEANSKSRVQVEVVAGSSTPGFRYNSFSARRNYGSQYAPTRNSRQKLFIFDKSVEPVKEYVFTIKNRDLDTSIGALKSIDGMILQSFLDEESDDYLKLECADNKDYFIYNVYKNNGGNLEFVTRVAVYSDETKIFSNFVGQPLEDFEKQFEKAPEAPDVKVDETPSGNTPSTTNEAIDIHATPQNEEDSAGEVTAQEPGLDIKRVPIPVPRPDFPGDSPSSTDEDTETPTTVDDLIDHLQGNDEQDDVEDSDQQDESGDEPSVSQSVDPVALPMPLWKGTKWNTTSNQYSCVVNSTTHLSTIRLSGSTPMGRELFENLRSRQKKVLSKIPVFSIVRLQKDMASLSRYEGVKVLSLSTNSKTDPNSMSKIGDRAYIHEDSLFTMDMGAFEILEQTPTRTMPGVSGEIAGKFAVLAKSSTGPKLLNCENFETKEKTNHLVFTLKDSDKKSLTEFAVEIESLGEFFSHSRGMPIEQIGEKEDAWANNSEKWLPKSTVSQGLGRYTRSSLPKKISDGAYWFVNSKKRALCRARGGSYCSRTGYCLRGVKWALLKAGVFSGYPGGVSAYAFGPTMRGRGMKDIYKDAKHRNKIKASMGNVPKGCVAVYSPTRKARNRCAWKRKRGRKCGGDKHGHIEIHTTRNQFVSDFIQRASMRSMNGAYRYITGVYCKY